MIAIEQIRPHAEEHMKVCIVGSWQARNYASSTKWKMQGSFQSFARACEQLGKMIALSGHSLIVASEDVETADWNTVKGFLRVATIDESLRVYIRQQKSGKRPYQTLATDYPD